ncbi:Bro-N domain-containing protein [Pseudomonas leptonychotis]|uniref:BRO-N domain-containing protein n=1 Tax=Pseudomonas leptonychotis TaxID=2448482 RepID=UPI0038673901
MNTSTAENNVIHFDFDKKQVRALLINEQPWLVAADVAAALEYRIAGNMTRMLDEDEKGAHIVSTPGGAQEMLVINESGLYSAILRSRKAEAKRFKKWVTAEVLPAIHKQGSYADTGNKMGTLLGETIGTNGFNMLGSLIKGKVTGLPRESQGRARSKIWSQTHAAFGVRSAADIPASQLDAARNFIAAYALEGEWLGKEQPVQCAMALDENSAANLRALCHHAEWLLRNWNATLAPALRHVRSQIEGDFHEHFVSAGLLARNLTAPVKAELRRAG